MSGERNSFDNFEELYTNCYWLVYRYVRHMVEKDLAAAPVEVELETEVDSAKVKNFVDTQCQGCDTGGVSGCISEMAGGAQTSESERFFAADS